MKKRSEVNAALVAEVEADIKRDAEESKARAIDVEETKKKMKPPPLEFPSAQPAEEHGWHPDFDRIIETMLIKDPWGTFQRLTDRLKVGEDRSSYGRMMQELDEAESCAREAHNLWMTARVEYRKWELNNQVVNAACRESATRDLDIEKKSGVRAKQITDADVESRAALLFPDEYRYQEIKRETIKRMVDSMQNLAELWLSRCRNLSTAVSKLRT